LAVGSYIGGAVIVGLVVLAALVVTAPLRQRNEYRERDEPQPILHEPPATGPKVKYRDWEVTGKASESAREVLEALRESGVIERGGPPATDAGDGDS
jgi:hypothetical protein